MKESARYGPDEKAVFEQLCQVVDEAIALYHQDGKPLLRQHRARFCQQDAERPRRQ